MQMIKGYEKAIVANGQFTFVEFPIVRELRFYEDAEDEDIVQKIDITLESDRRRPNSRLYLRFTGVSRMIATDFGGGQTRVIGFDVVDISDKGWERINWQVCDYEEGKLSFYCETAEIISLDPVSDS